MNRVAQMLLLGVTFAAVLSSEAGIDREFFAELLKIPSVTADCAKVNEAVEFVRTYLEKDGVACTVEADAEGRKSLYASTMPGKVQDYLLVVHLDVVPGDSDQFVPRFEDGKVFARGAEDCKGNAVMAAQILKELNGKASVGAIFSSNEEIGGSTVGFMVSRGYLAKKLVLVADAGSDGVYYAQKGNCYIRVRAVGKGGHSSRPKSCVNPIEKLMSGWKHFCAAWPAAPEDGWGDLVSITRIAAGDADNRIPDTAEMTVNLRSVSADAQDRAVKLLKESGFEIVQVRSTGVPMTTDANAPEVRRLLAARKATWPDRDVSFHRMMAITDARHFATSGIPTVMVGALGGAAHGKGEWIELRSLDENVEMFKRFFTDKTYGEK